MSVSHAPPDSRPECHLAPTVLIASKELVARWSERASTPTDLIVVEDTDVDHALDIIRRHHAQTVILEQIFSASARGVALVNDLRTTPDLEQLQIRTLPEGRASLAADQANGQTLTGLSAPLGRQPSRRERRVAIRSGVAAMLDGFTVTLVELSTAGGHVVSDRIIKPHQRVRLVIAGEGESCRAEGTAVWSRAELTSRGLVYHAGIAFAEERPELLASVLSEVAD